MDKLISADSEETQPPPPDKLFSTTVSIRGFQKFLTSHHVGGVAIACVCENHCIIAYVYIGKSNRGRPLTSRGDRRGRWCFDILHSGQDG